MSRGSLLGTDAQSEELAECLARADYGVLGLARGSEAYTFPVSFGYDPDLTAVYFLFVFGSDSKKRSFVEAGGTASFTVVDADLPDAWASVIVTGTLEPVPDDERERGYAALAETAEFPAPYTFEDYLEAGLPEQGLYKLTVEELTGRRANPEDLTDDR
ncbi:MAG: pyridoxamine 5'-phosphate oxidase family protein [Salinigranum sp.]